LKIWMNPGFDTQLISPYTCRKCSVSRAFVFIPFRYSQFFDTYLG
jgi:hypothetical protein